MNKKYSVCKVSSIILVVGLVVCANIAFADEPIKRKNYGQAKLGAFIPTGDMDDTGYDTGFNTGVAYGRYLTDYIKLEGGVDFITAKLDISGANLTIGSYSQDDLLSVGALLVTLKGEYPLGPVDLVAGAGVGLYGASLTSEVDSNRYGIFDGDDYDTVMGAHLTLGANYNITERFYLGLEGSYRWTGDVDMRDMAGSVPVEYKGDLSGYTVAVTGGFRF